MKILISNKFLTMVTTPVVQEKFHNNFSVWGTYNQSSFKTLRILSCTRSVIFCGFGIAISNIVILKMAPVKRLSLITKCFVVVAAMATLPYDTKGVSNNSNSSSIYFFQGGNIARMETSLGTLSYQKMMKFTYCILAIINSL